MAGGGDIAAVSEVIPQGEAEFLACFHEAGEGAAGLAPGLGFSAAGVIAPGDMHAEIVIGAAFPGRVSGPRNAFRRPR